MLQRDDLGKRMKEFYEQIFKTKLLRRMPVAIRMDGRSFHTYTKGFQRPFDEVFIKSMQETIKYLLPTDQKRESCCIKINCQNSESIMSSNRINGWVIDTGIPIFKGEDMAYIDKLIYVGEN